MSKEERNKIVPRLRFPEFWNLPAWIYINGDEVFEQVSNKNHSSDLPILAITQEYGAIPRDKINYNVTVTDKSIESYKVVNVGDFIISLRSFQGGVEYSSYKGLCSPAYIILRKKKDAVDNFFKHYFKTQLFISNLNKNIEGIRDGKMVSYKQFSELVLPLPSKVEQQKIADCLSSLDDLITAQSQKLEALKAHKKGLKQQLFPAEGETVPKLRFAEFRDSGEWEKTILGSICSSIASGKDKVEVNGKYDLYGSTGIIGKTSDYSFEGDFILIARVGANAGLLTRTSEKFGVTDNTLVVSFYDSENIDFVSYTLEKFGLNKLVFGSGQPLITGGQLKSLSIVLPKPKEQQKIANCLSSLDELITAQAEKIEALKAHKKGLMQGLFPKLKSR